MTRQEIFEGVKAVLEDSLQVSPDIITPQASLSTDLGADSLDVMDIVVRLNRRFALKLSAKELGDQLGLGRLPSMPAAPAFSSDGDVTTKQLAGAQKIANMLTVDFLVDAIETYQSVEAPTA